MKISTRLALLAEALLLLTGYCLCIAITHMLDWLSGGHHKQSDQEREDAARHQRHMQAHERRSAMRAVSEETQQNKFDSSQGGMK